LEQADRCQRVGTRPTHRGHTPRKRSIQYAGTCRLNHGCLWTAGSCGQAGRACGRVYGLTRTKISKTTPCTVACQGAWRPTRSREEHLTRRANHWQYFIIPKFRKTPRNLTPLRPAGRAMAMFLMKGNDGLFVPAPDDQLERSRQFASTRSRFCRASGPNQDQGDTRPARRAAPLREASSILRASQVSRASPHNPGTAPCRPSARRDRKRTPISIRQQCSDLGVLKRICQNAEQLHMSPNSQDKHVRAFTVKISVKAGKDSLKQSDVVDELRIVSMKYRE